MLTKTLLFQTIKSFREQDHLDRMTLIEKIEIGLNQSHSRQILTTEKAKEKLEKWLK